MTRGAWQRTLVGLAALVLLLVAVAVASTGSVPAGTGGARSPSDRLLDVLISLLLVWMAFGAVLIVYLLLLRRGAPEETAAALHKRRPWSSLLGLALGFGLLALLVRWFWVDSGQGPGIKDGLLPGLGGSGDGSPTSPGDYEPEFATGPVLLILGLLAIALTTWGIAHRARRRRLRGSMPESLLPALSDVLDETLDDLRAETDPRRAVIAAYARMERALAAFGLPRSPSEAPAEYLERIFADLDVSRRATSRLTALFTWAKFSSHDVAPEMKDEAIEALEAMREELRAAELLAEQQRAAALAGLRERAGGR